MKQLFCPAILVEKSNFRHYIIPWDKQIKRMILS